MDSPGEAAQVLRELRDFGVKVYLDDFGTGYSSLSHLHKLPVDALKIDRSFVASLLLPGRPAIVESILALARTLNTSVVAEGVEASAGARAGALGCRTRRDISSRGRWRRRCRSAVGHTASARHGAATRPSDAGASVDWRHSRSVRRDRLASAHRFPRTGVRPRPRRLLRVLVSPRARPGGCAEIGRADAGHAGHARLRRCAPPAGRPPIRARSRR